MLQPVEGALYREGAAVEDVRVDHRRLEAAVAEECLQCSNVSSIFQ